MGLETFLSFFFRRLQKKLEHTWKAIVHDGDTVSVTRPSYYASRFQDFMTKHVFKKMPRMYYLLHVIINVSVWITFGNQCDTHLVSMWCPFDIHVVPIWYPCDAHLISMWCPFDIYVMPIWYPCDAIWYPCDAHLISMWCPFYIYVMPIWYPCDAIWYPCDTYLVYLWCRFGIHVIPI